MNNLELLFLVFTLASVIILIVLLLIVLSLARKQEVLYTQTYMKSEENQSKIKEILHERLDLISKRMFDVLRAQQIQTTKDFNLLTDKIDFRLDKINQKVDERLRSGFENVDKTFKDIIVGIAKISEAQKVIEALSGEVVSLQDILTDKKSRGIFGETQLNIILSSIFGDKEQVYKTQYRLPNNMIADAVIKAPYPLGLIAIDSKFPLENYRRMIEDEKYISNFKINLKKHIDDISSKYIINEITAPIAILFIPAEAIFSEIHARHESIIELARSRGVWIASPTTLMAILTTILAIMRDVKTQEQARKIKEELLRLSNNFKLYKDRWEKLSNHIEMVSKDVKDITVTTNKISSEFDRIKNVEFDQKLVD